MIYKIKTLPTKLSTTINILLQTLLKITSIIATLSIHFPTLLSIPKFIQSSSLIGGISHVMKNMANSKVPLQISHKDGKVCLNNKFVGEKELLETFMNTIRKWWCKIKIAIVFSANKLMLSSQSIEKKTQLTRICLQDKLKQIQNILVWSDMRIDRDSKQRWFKRNHKNKVFRAYRMMIIANPMTEWGGIIKSWLLMQGLNLFVKKGWG